MLPIEDAILGKLRSGPCRFDEVAATLSKFSWAEIVECMSRDGRIAFLQLGYATYLLSLGAQFTCPSDCQGVKQVAAADTQGTTGKDQRKVAVLAYELSTPWLSAFQNPRPQRINSALSRTMSLGG